MRLGLVAGDERGLERLEHIRGGTFYNTCGIVGGSFGINDAEMEYNSVAGLEVRVPESRPHVRIARVEANVTAGRERLDPSVLL